MDVLILLGILLIGMGAFASGSFAVPFGALRKWSWESYWLIFSFGAYILFPLIFCLIFSPVFLQVFESVSSKTIAWIFFLGMIYGIGNLSFGLSLRYLGLSLGYALSLGLMLGIGTLVPPLLDGRLKFMLEGMGGKLLIIGIFTAFVGIFITGWAGYRKNLHLSKTEKQDKEFDFVKGLLAAVLVGITGSAIALGFEHALPISAEAERLGTNPLFSIMPVFVVLLSGTFLTTLVWCIYLGIKNKSISEYRQIGLSSTVLLKNYSFSLLAGLIWLVQFILFGMGKSMMGPYTFTSWGILMALTIVSATLWGFYRGEWKQVPKKTYRLAIASVILIIISSFAIGISGSL